MLNHHHSSLSKASKKPLAVFGMAAFLLMALAVFGGLFLSYQAIRLSNLQSCMNLAQNHSRTTGKSDQGEWVVEEVGLNKAIYQECISKKQL